MEAEATLGSASALALSVINLRVSSASVTLPVHVLRTERGGENTKYQNITRVRKPHKASKENLF